MASRTYYDSRDYWQYEWKIAERDGDLNWGLVCKEKYRQIVMKEILKEPSIYFVEKLKALPTAYLN